MDAPTAMCQAVQVLKVTDDTERHEKMRRYSRGVPQSYDGMVKMLMCMSV